MAVRVLIVDDASFVRDLVKRTMRSYFPEVTLEEAINGRKAQLAMSKSQFDLILCDWEMPEMSGIELLSWARQQANYQKIPFVMVTSRGDRSFVLEAIQQGASDYLTKPFSPEMLVQKVVKHLGKKVRRAPSSNVPGAGTDSVSVLTGASVKTSLAGSPPVNTVADAAASILTGSSRNNKSAPASNSEKTSVGKKKLAQVRFADFILPCIIKSVTLNEVKVVARRDQKFPAILESAVVDIEVDENSKIERINGYVHMLQAVEKRVDTEFINVVIRFVDEDPEKMASLSKYIARI
jgi:CheY-like chemotaxis protein